MSTRKSAAKQKQATANARTYPRASDAMLAEKCACLPHPIPTQEVRDAIAEREILGAYPIKLDTAEDGTRTIRASDKCSCGLLLTRLGTCPMGCE